MTVYVEVPYYGVIEVDEATHMALIRHIPRRILKIWRKLADKVHDMNKVIVSKVTFSEWLYLAYQQRNYWIYKRLQVVRILYQPEDKETRKSPRPFADIRAWEYKQFFGEQADEEIEEGSEFTVRYEVSYSGTIEISTLEKLDEETEYLQGIFPSITCAYYHGSITEVTVATEVELVDEDEVEDIDVMHRAVIIYRHNPDFAMAWEYGDKEDQKAVLEIGIGLEERVGVYKDEAIRELEERLMEAYYKITGKKLSYQEFRDMILEMVLEGNWAELIIIQRGAGFMCRGVML